MTIKSAQELVTAANADVQTLSAEEAAKLASDPNLVFVDVREAEELRKTGKVKDAVHAPRSFLEFHADPNNAKHVPALSSGKQLVLYCGSGSRSALAAMTLKTMGITNISHVSGGLPAIQEAGWEMEQVL